MMNSNKTTASKSFEYKTKIIGNMSNNNNILDTEVVIPLKYLSNFWTSLDLPLINCEIELNLKWTKTCVVSEISRTFMAVDPNANPFEYEVSTATAGGTPQINNTRLFVPVVMLPINNNVNFLENIKQGYKRKISWKRYRSEIITQPKNNNLDYLIHLTIRNINRLFVISFKNDYDDPLIYFLISITCHW